MTGIQFPKPDASILARRDAIIEGLKPLVAPKSLITTEDERRAFETDALTAYRRMPLAVVLPRSTEELSAVMAYLHRRASMSLRAAPARRSPAAPSRRKMPSSSASPKWLASSISITPIGRSACSPA